MRKNEVLAAQKKLDSLEIKINIETEKLLAERTEKLGAAQKILDDVTKEIVEQADLFQQARGAQEHTYSFAEAEIQNLEYTKDKLNEVLTSLARQKSDLTVSIDKQMALLSTQKTENETLRTSIPLLIIEKEALETEILGLRAYKAELVKKNTKVLEDYKAETTQKERLLDNIDIKIHEKTQLLERQIDELQIVRNAMAKRQLELDEREKNLRLRETKVEQSEDKLLINANLLNL